MRDWKLKFLLVSCALENWKREEYNTAEKFIFYKKKKQKKKFDVSVLPFRNHEKWI